MTERLRSVPERIDDLNLGHLTQQPLHCGADRGVIVDQHYTDRVPDSVAQDTAQAAPGAEVTISRKMPPRRPAGQSDVGLKTATGLTIMRKPSPSFHRPRPPAVTSSGPYRSRLLSGS
jgi:hypothetical protein